MLPADLAKYLLDHSIQHYDILSELQKAVGHAEALNWAQLDLSCEQAKQLHAFQLDLQQRLETNTQWLKQHCTRIESIKAVAEMLHVTVYALSPCGHEAFINITPDMIESITFDIGTHNGYADDNQYCTFYQCFDSTVRLIPHAVRRQNRDQLSPVTDQDVEAILNYVEDELNSLLVDASLNWEYFYDNPTIPRADLTRSN